MGLVQESRFNTELLQCTLTSEVSTPVPNHVFLYRPYPVSPSAQDLHIYQCLYFLWLTEARALEGFLCPTYSSRQWQSPQGAFLRWKKGSLDESFPSFFPLGFMNRTESHSTKGIVLSQISSTFQNFHLGLNTALWCLSSIEKKSWE